MDQLLEKIEQYKQEIAAIGNQASETLEAYRIKFLGTKGIVKNLMTEMKNVPSEKKKEFGQLLNEFKQYAESRYENWKLELESNGTSNEPGIDSTLPGDPIPVGSRHPIALCVTRSFPSSSDWVSLYLKDQKLKMTSTILLH